MRRDALVATALWLATGACAEIDSELEPLQWGSLAMFETDVQPRLLERCAAGGCHGRADRPLPLYAPGALRMDMTRVFLDEPLTTQETSRNAQCIAALAHGVAPESSLVLCKPLAVAAGGCAHGGGDVFPDRSDPDYRALLAWLRERDASDGGAP